jgi:penicillin-binding protein 2
METSFSSKTQSWLPWFFRGFLVLGFLVLTARLIDLQIIRGSYYRSLAEENRIRRVPIMAPRGEILARGGEVLASSQEQKKRVIFDPKEGFRKVDEIEGISEDELIEEWVRRYDLGVGAAHISGYLGEVNENELGKVEAECPNRGSKRLGFLTGRTGLEEAYDCVLRGIDGDRLVEVDARGDQVRTLGYKEPVAGKNIRTSIHYGLQQKVAELMKGKKGAVVVSDTNGGIIALHSAPSYDPNVFVSEGNADQVRMVLENDDLPLFNRSISGLYPPGSIYKPIVAVAALEEKVVNEDFVYDDTGQITIKTPYGDFTYSNWYFTQYGGVEGKIDLVRAIARSTDTFFYKLGELIGIEKLIEWSSQFGLDKEQGIDLPGETSGLIPSPTWKLREKGEKWFLGNTYHLSIGQGDIALTPLSINMAISAIASGGKLCKPQIVTAVWDGGKWTKVESQCQNIQVDMDTTNLTKQGLVEACSPGGTGYTFFDFKDKNGTEVACKTGTAEGRDRVLLVQ